MHLGYIYILLSLLSYSSLGILHKVAEAKELPGSIDQFSDVCLVLVFLLAVVSGLSARACTRL